MWLKRFRCALEDCLKQFVTAEQVENYRCSHCWHIAAIKYLSSVGENEMEIKKLRRCRAQDSCDCQRLLHLETLPWSNNFSHTLKQLSISHCPKILCIHLQRASMNMFGDLVKLQGHISFPLILDLFPFVRCGVGIKDVEESWQLGQAKLQHKKHICCPNNANMNYDAKMPSSIYGLMGENIYTKVLARDELGNTANVKTFMGESKLPQTDGNSKTISTDLQTDDEVKVLSQSCPSETYFYRLASVVEHFGRVGSGHYTVYRSVRAKSDKENQDEHLGTTRWFCVSDSQVYSVSEKDVLGAEASLLFYERITES